MTTKYVYPFLKNAENKKTFFERISLFLPELDPRYKAIEKAYNIAKDAFREIKREGGDRYFEHLRAVALFVIEYLRVRDYEVIIAALIHDLVEDIPSWTVERVEREFGERVALLVDFLSKPSKENYPVKEERERVYHTRLNNASREVFLIKLSDRLHNLETLGDCPVEKQKRKIEETKHYYMPLAEKHQILIHEIEAAMLKIEKET